MTTLKFFWNGIKENGGKLQKCWYSDGPFTSHPAGTITIYARDYNRFSAGVNEAFAVLNDTDMQTDYFETDRIRVTPSHALYAQVQAACASQAAHSAKRQERWDVKHGLNV